MELQLYSTTTETRPSYYTFQNDAFRDARIRELSLRSCGLAELSQGAFGGLEPTLQLLDLSANNLTDFPKHLFHEFDFLRTLNLRDNKLPPINPSDTLNGFQYSVYRLDMSGLKMGVSSLQDLRRLTVQSYRVYLIHNGDCTTSMISLFFLFIRNITHTYIHTHAHTHTHTNTHTHTGCPFYKSFFFSKKKQD